MEAPQGPLTRRITGIETEYGITCTVDGSQRLSPDDIARYLFRPVIEEFGSTNIFTNNAARLYLDVGSHPEYATAECDRLSQLIAHDRAGDFMLNRLAEQAEESLAKEGITGKVYLFRNNVDSVGNSYGCHENYLISRSTSLKKLGVALLPFMVTRQLLCGAGMVNKPLPGSLYDGEPVSYTFAQRADHVWEGVSSATTRSRPIINTRDEPHADSNAFRRMHVIVGDSNMSECTTALKVGSTHLVLEMLEANWPLPDLEVANEIKSIRAVSRDLSGKAGVLLRDGRTLTALEIQRIYCDAATEYLAQRADNAEGTSNADMARVIDLWQRVIAALDTGDLSGIDTEIDWAIKKKLLDGFMRRGGFGLDHPRIAQLDLSYHDIRPGRGLFPVLEAKGLAKRWVDPVTVAEAENIAPSTTRAALRGQFLKAAREAKADITVDWTHLKINRPEPRMVVCENPFENESADVAELIAAMQQRAQQ